MRWLVSSLVLLGTVCGGACSPELASATEPAESVPLIRVRMTRPLPVAATDAVASHLYVERDVRVTARRSGLIERVLADRGQHVTQNQALAVLETDLAAAEVKMVEQELRYRQVEFDRARELPNIVSAQEALRLEVARDLTQSELELARSHLERCTVRAPFDGVIVERWAVTGQRVIEDSNSPLFRLVADDPLRARVYVTQTLLPRLAPGDPASIEPIEGGAGRAARIVFVSPAVDPASGTAAVVVELDSSEGLRIGESVGVRFSPRIELADAAFRLPVEALVEPLPIEGHGATIFVEADGRAMLKNVRVVELRGPEVVVRGELSSDDRIVWGAEGGLAPGDPVEIRETLR
jgi:RND family efflux transporter MFP subunit